MLNFASDAALGGHTSTALDMYEQGTAELLNAIEIETSEAHKDDLRLRVEDGLERIEFLVRRIETAGERARAAVASELRATARVFVPGASAHTCEPRIGRLVY